MPLPGGASGKAGLEYELLWTAHCLTRVMAGDALSIRLEPPGEEGIGIEFTLATAECVEHHQVKRQRAGRGVWSLKTLVNEGVLPHFRQRLNGDPTARCVFVSGHAAHPLDELADRARKSDSWGEFESEFISSAEWGKHFGDLHRLWNSTDRRDTYEYLKRICVITGDESTLRTMVCNKLEALVGKEPDNALDILAQFALGQTHKRLGAADIWDHMEARGFPKKDWQQDTSVARTIAELNQAYLAGIKPLGIGGEVVHRTRQVEEALSIFDESDAKRVALIAGVAGVGKSSAVSQVIDKVENRGWQILALRVDRLQPCATPIAIGEQLGLPTSPASVLAGIAQGGDCLLVVDQLDAVSEASGRNPEFFDCVGALMDQARSHPKMRVLAACREFDVKNDSRLRELVSEHGIARQVSIRPFDDATVQHIAARIGLNADNLTPRQIEILSLPIHMRLLSEVVKDSGKASVDFQTGKELYDEFWRKKRLALSKSIPESDLRAAVGVVIDRMNIQETLFMNEAALDEHQRAVDAMASENILVRDGAKYGFFHETFFDYLFARSATADPDFDLTQYILEREPQSLFLRSQVRQILLHQRADSSEKAARAAADLLAKPGVRTHIKALVLALLGSLEKPTQEDWDAIRPLLQSKLSSHAWNSIRGSAAWFDLLDKTLGVIEQWLRGADQSLIRSALWLTKNVHKHRSARAAELLSPFLANPTEDWKERLIYIVSLSEFGASKEYFDFVRKAFDAGMLDNSLVANGKGEAWWQLKELGERNPDWACELIATYCNRLMSIAGSRGNPNPFSTDGVDPHKTGGDALIYAAKASPIKFITELMPFIIRILKLNGDQTDGGRLRDPFVRYFEIPFSHPLLLREAFFVALESAMCQIAEEHPDFFRGIVHLLRKYQCEDYPSIRQILTRAYAAAGESFADEAVEYLLQNHEIRFSPSHVQGYEAIQQLLKLSTSHCSAENLNRLEQAILGYYPKSEYPKFKGASQYILLEALDHSRVTTQSTKRLQELRRKFGESKSLTKPMTIIGDEVGPPISTDAAQKMSDEHWLTAMKKYSQDNFDGGADELSRVLETQVRNDPTRFANLIHRIPDNANKMYFYAILAGLTDVAVETSLAISAVKRCHIVPGQPLGRQIAGLLGKALDAELPADALDILAWYATKAPNPVGEPNWATSVGGARQERDLQDMMNAGLNTDRGAAAYAIARLLFHNENYLASFKPHLTSMVNDRSIAVRAMVAYILMAVLRCDRDLAVKLFSQLCAADDILLGTPYVEHFIRYAATTHWDDIKPVIARMLKSDIDEVAAAGGRQACLASLTEEDAIPLAQNCVSGATAQRLGAAQVYAANLRFSEHRAACQSMLETLFSAPDADVRIAASRCFDRFDGGELASYESLIDAFVKSAAFKDGHRSLIHALTRTTARMPNAILAAAETFIATYGTAAADIRAGVSRYSEDIAKLAIRVYEQETDSSTRRRCLDLIDKLVEAQAGGASSAIEEFER